MTDTYDYEGKFTLSKGDTFMCAPRSYYIDNEGIRHIVGAKGKYTFLRTAQDGILGVLAGTMSTEYIYMGPERQSELTGTILRAHKLTIPKKKTPIRTVKDLVKKFSKKKKKKS